MRGSCNILWNAAQWTETSLTGWVLCLKGASNVYKHRWLSARRHAAWATHFQGLGENTEAGSHFGPGWVMMDQAEGTCTFSKLVVPDQPRFPDFWQSWVIFYTHSATVNQLIYILHILSVGTQGTDELSNFAWRHTDNLKIQDSLRIKAYSLLKTQLQF